jgi:S1-C subfamily serine protease
MVQSWFALCIFLIGLPLERAFFGTSELFLSPLSAGTSIVKLVKKVRPAVVNISFQTAPAVSAQESVGSGFVISSRGLILTNAHVIAKTGTIVVHFANNDSYPATLVVADKESDVALLRIEPGKPLTFIPLGDSARVEVGEWVIAIGNPFGLGQTVTAGIISAKGRVLGAGPYDNYFQTDASINPGNSGGPLVNMKGQAIGINAASISTANGMGFAIPIASALRVIAPYFSSSTPAGETGTAGDRLPMSID